MKAVETTRPPQPPRRTRRETYQAANWLATRAWSATVLSRHTVRFYGLVGSAPYEHSLRVGGKAEVTRCVHVRPCVLSHFLGRPRCLLARQLLNRFFLQGALVTRCYRFEPKWTVCVLLEGAFMTRCHCLKQKWTRSCFLVETDVLSYLALFFLHIVY